MGKTSIAKTEGSFSELERLKKDRISVVGEIPYKAEWFPNGKYEGYAKELGQKLSESKIRLVYFPEADNDNVLACLPQIKLSSGFEAVVYPACIRYNSSPFPQHDKKRDIYMEQQLEINPIHGFTIYSFMEGGSIDAYNESDKKKRINLAVKNLQKRFNQKGKQPYGLCLESEVEVGLGTIRMRGIIDRFSGSHIKKLLHLLNENGFDGCNLHTHMIYTSSSKWRPLIASCELKDSSKPRHGNELSHGIQFFFSYKWHDDSYVGRPNVAHITMNSSDILTGSDLELLEKMTTLL